MQPGHDAVDAAGQHNGADDVPLARTQTQRTLTVALGHRFQGFLGGADDGGQVHDHQRQAAGEQAGLEAQRLGKHQHPHQTVNDTGDAASVSLVNSITEMTLRFWAYSVR